MHTLLLDCFGQNLGARSQMDFNRTETWACLWLFASTSDEDHTRFLQACREHSAACIECCSSADLIQAVLGAALSDSSCSGTNPIGGHCIHALLTKRCMLDAGNHHPWGIVERILPVCF